MVGDHLGERTNHGSATPLWTCNAIPDAADQSFYAPLQNECLDDRVAEVTERDHGSTGVLDG